MFLGRRSVGTKLAVIFPRWTKLKGGNHMRAIVIDHFGPGLDSLIIKEVPEPEPKPGHVIIEVKAFGINHAEMHMRKGEWAEAAEISGIECVGLVKSCPGGEFAVGSKVAALMGGLGRTINGSYAEYTRALAIGVAQIESDLPWEELAAIPESYATAWTCLFRNLELTKDQTLVIRGATSSFGQAALNMAVDAGAKVIATTRNRERFKKLEDLGAHRVELEGRDLSKRIAEVKHIDAVLDLVGNSTILDSPLDAAPGWSRLLGWVVGRSRSDRRLQPAPANGKRRLSNFLRQLRVRHAAVSPLGRTASGHRRKGGRRPL
jgi:NADPH2:quinone reductase